MGRSRRLRSKHPRPPFRRSRGHCSEGGVWPLRGARSGPSRPCLGLAEGSRTGNRPKVALLGLRLSWRSGPQSLFVLAVHAQVQTAKDGTEPVWSDGPLTWEKRAQTLSGPRSLDSSPDERIGNRVSPVIGGRDTFFHGQSGQGGSRRLSVAAELLGRAQTCDEREAAPRSRPVISARNRQGEWSRWIPVPLR